MIYTTVLAEFGILYSYWTENTRPEIPSFVREQFRRYVMAGTDTDHNYYELLIDAVTTVGLLLASIKRIFFELIKLIMNRFKMLSHAITTFVLKVAMSFSVFPLLFMILWNILLEFVNIILYPARLN